MRSLTTRRIGVVTTLLGLAGAGIGLAAAPASAVAGPEVAPIFLAGASNQNCSDLDDSYGGGQTWLEVDTSPANGTTGPITITSFDPDTRTFTWSSTIGIDAVYVKGGAGGSNLYVYAPTADSPEAFGDDGLTTPGTSGNGVSHMSFCYDTSDPTTTTTSTTSTTSTTVPETTTSTTSTTVPETTTTTSTTVPETTTTTSTTVPETTTSTTSTTVPATTSTTAAVGGSSTTSTTAANQVLGQQQNRALPRTGGDTGGLVALSLGVITLGLGLILLGNGAQVLATRRRP